MPELSRYVVEDQERWRDWVEKIPSITFKPDWAIRVIPPFAGAMARFLVLKDDKRVSVYLDCFDSLGYYGEPYWEVYPVNGDTGRVAMNDTTGLIDLIEDALASE